MDRCHRVVKWSDVSNQQQVRNLLKKIEFCQWSHFFGQRQPQSANYLIQKNFSSRSMQPFNAFVFGETCSNWPEAVSIFTTCVLTVILYN